MNTRVSTTRTPNQHRFVIFGAVLLAFLAALAYLLIAQHILAIGEYSQTEGPAGIIYAAAGCYLVGGLLILTRRRWLWLIGAVINALVILFFLQMYQHRPSILFSPGGIVTKAAQLFLEVLLVYLIFTFRSHSQSAK